MKADAGLAATNVGRLRRFALLLGVSNLVLITLLFGAGFLGLQASRAADIASTGEAAENLTAALSADIASELRLVDHALTTVASAFKGHANALERRLAIERALVEQKAMLTQADALRMADASGMVTYGLAAGSAPISIADREYFVATKATPNMVISEPVQGRLVKKWGVAVAKRVESDDGAFAGVVYSNLSTEKLASRFGQLKLGQFGAATLRSGSLRLIARYSPSSPTSESDIGTAKVSAELEDALRRNPRSGWFVSRTAMDGVERVSSYRRVDGSDMIVLVGLSTADMLAPWRRDAQMAALLLSVASIALIFVSVLVYIERRKSYRAEERIAALLGEQQVMLDNELVGMARTRGRHTVWHNKAMSEIFGYPPEELLDTPSRTLYADEDSWRRVGQDGYAALAERGSFRTQVQMRRKDGTLIWVNLYGAPINGEDSMWMFADVTGMKSREVELSQKAHHDPLTGLANRAQLHEYVEQVVGGIATDAIAAVCFFDLDGFKAVNDKYGHAAGDEVLVHVAERLRNSVRSHDMVARLGGDEFVVVLSRMQDAQQVDSILQRMLALVQGAMTLKSGEQVFVGASVGVALTPTDGRSVAELMRLADAAMYDAKRHGKGRIRYAPR